MYQIEKLIKLQRKVESWGKKVGLYDPENGSNLLNQYLYAFAEFGEAAQDELKGKEEGLIDGIGDTFVCLVHAQKFLYGKDFHIMKFRIDEFGDYSVREILSHVPDYIVKKDFNSAVTLLIILSHKITGKPYKCFETAYNEIKDREGRMISGVFLKRQTLEEQGIWD